LDLIKTLPEVEGIGRAGRRKAGNLERRKKKPGRTQRNRWQKSRRLKKRRETVFKLSCYREKSGDRRRIGEEYKGNWG